MTTNFIRKTMEKKVKITYMTGRVAYNVRQLRDLGRNSTTDTTRARQ